MKKRECIINTNIITKDSILENHAVVIEEDRIEKILPMELMREAGPDYAGMNVHDGRDAYISSGFIDIHSDNIESVVQPRPTSIMDFGIALMEHEKQLVNQGITTMYHSLSFLRRNGSAMRDKEARKPEKMQELVELIKNLHERDHLIRHRFHCRFDIRNTGGYDTLMEYLDKDYIHLLSFNDHTPGQGQYRDLDRFRENQKNYNPRLGDEEIDRIIEDRMAVPKISREMIARTADVAHGKKIPIASHDDDTEEKIEYVHSELKADISEFPVEIEVARKAKKKGMLTVAGAPNVLLGKSHSGNMSAVEAILDGCIDILCSDYYPPSMLHAAFKLHKEYGLHLWESMNLITLNPARALGTEKDFGSVEPGKKADLLMIKVVNGNPAILKVFINGWLVSALNYRGSFTEF